ncbi:MAG: DNA adenine methylase [Planctomycetia bacterium]|nr:DNA adenine methylase [Planctomycetia bacterium]
MCISEICSQRSDLTFKYNISESRHGWLRLTPAYSVKLVRDILAQYEPGLGIFDPFSGTATTTLVASELGYTACSCDINPFLVWLGNVKLANYSADIVKDLLTAGNVIEENITGIDLVSPPPISFIERWWSEKNLWYLCAIKAGIEKYTDRDHVYNLLLIAFCRLVIELSNASFSHQSVSFKKKNDIDIQLTLWGDGEDTLKGKFMNNVCSVVDSVKYNPLSFGKVFIDDSRYLTTIQDRQFDLVITSPPYPNRMSYIRELRPYMFWLGYLSNSTQAGKIDWEAIGGTWGIATSRLNDWCPTEKLYLTQTLQKTLKAIRTSGTKSGDVMSKYVDRYFHDMYLHFKAIYRVMKSSGKIHYIIGNSKFYDTMVSAELIYGELLELTGFRNICTNIIRKRNSKKELFEFEVTASK